MLIEGKFEWPWRCVMGLGGLYYMGKCIRLYKKWWCEWGIQLTNNGHIKVVWPICHCFVINILQLYKCHVIFSRLSRVNVLLKMEMNMCEMNVVACSRILPILPALLEVYWKVHCSYLSLILQIENTDTLLKQFQFGFEGTWIIHAYTLSNL